MDFGFSEEQEMLRQSAASDAASWITGATLVVDGGNIRAAEIVQMGL